MYEVRQLNTLGKIQKIICSLGKSDSPDLDPLVDLVVNGYNIPQVVVDFGSQVNVLLRSTWIKIGRPQLQELGIYIRLEDQGLIAPIGVLKKAKTSIMAITTMIDYEVIDIQDKQHTYPTLVGRPWGRKMKASISLEKGRIKIKGKGRRMIIPLDPVKGKYWEEVDDDDVDA